jgi:hypothetical protein
MISKVQPFNGFDYVFNNDPAADTNPPYVAAKWLNLDTGEVFVCTDATPGSNVWRSAKNYTTPVFGSNTIRQYLYPLTDSESNDTLNPAYAKIATISGAQAQRARVEFVGAVGYAAGNNEHSGGKTFFLTFANANADQTLLCSSNSTGNNSTTHIRAIKNSDYSYDLYAYIADTYYSGFVKYEGAFTEFNPVVEPQWSGTAPTGTGFTF